jgi:hypothetical protein
MQQKNVQGKVCNTVKRRVSVLIVILQTRNLKYSKNTKSFNLNVGYVLCVISKPHQILQSSMQWPCCSLYDARAALRFAFLILTFNILRPSGHYTYRLL